MLHPNSRYPHPGKFEGERMLLVLAYSYLNEGMDEDSFGDVSEWPYYHMSLVDMGPKYGKVGVKTSESGFVSEVSAERFAQARDHYFEELSEQEAREELIHEVTEQLEELRANEFPCDQCNALSINGMRMHESASCPNAVKIRTLEKKFDALESY